jgi:muramidase (phage lysozyme)
MVDLPQASNAIVTSQAPTSAITPAIIQQQANSRAAAIDKTASAYGKVADDLMEVSTRLAKNQAAEDLMQQKVTRDADGNVTVQNPASAPLIFGDAGRAYSDAVKVGTIAQHSNSLSQDFAELHQEYPTDPAGFKKAAEAHLAKTSQAVTGPLGQAVQVQGNQLLTQHFNAITSVAASNDLENQKKSITSQIEDQKNTAIALARQNGADSPEFKQAIEKMNLSYDALATNPLFKMPPDQIEREKKNTFALLQGEALVSHVDSTFTKRGKADAQKALEEGILKNPNLREVDRSRLYAQGLSRLGYLTADAKANIDANRQITTEMEGGLAKGTIKPEDPAVGLAIQRARAIGDTEGAQRITAAAAVKQQLRGVQSLPDAIRDEMLGRPGGAVNTSLPPEARGLLDTIAKTESAGRYNVRYGDRTFQDFGDHPRVAEPITSGPDVGKTSSAAGRYQFIAPTWDAQKAKLGLKDFSPASQDTAAWDLAQTEYKAKTGKDLLTTLKSGDTADVLPSLSGQWSSLPGGRQPAKQFGGFTPEQVQQNPFLISAYVRTLSHDPELRVQSAKQSADAVMNSARSGLAPPPNGVAEAEQAYALYPEKMGEKVAEMRGVLNGQVISRLPQEQQAQVLDAYKRASEGQDVFHTNMAIATQKQVDAANKNMVDHPYDEAAQRGWTKPAMPIDPGQPESIAPALVQRADLSARIGALNHTPNPPLLEKDEMPKLQAALQGPAGPAVLGTIAQGLKPEEMNTLLGEKGFVDSVTGMMSSKDPARMTAGMSMVDKIWRDNAANAEGKFGSAAVTRLQAWQALRDSFNPVELAERLNASDDPSTLKAREEAKDAAEKEVKTLTPADMAYKLGTSWGIPIVSRVANVVTGATPAVPFDSIKGGELVADYRATYTSLRAYGVDADKASELAVQRLGSTWGVSAAAGNQVMKNPPEKSPMYPKINGSHDWIGDDLNKWVTGKAGAQFTAGQRSIEAGVGLSGSNRNWNVEGLIADGQTQAEIAGGRPPSYQVAIKKADGTLSIIPSRIAFDPADHIAKHGDNLQGKRDNMEVMDKMFGPKPGENGVPDSVNTIPEKHSAVYKPGQKYAQADINTESSIHTIKEGPEYNKWDEALQKYGAIRIPKELDEPQKWLDHEHIKDFLKRNGVDREDRPDGSVILSKKALTS